MGLADDIHAQADQVVHHPIAQFIHVLVAAAPLGQLQGDVAPFLVAACALARRRRPHQRVLVGLDRGVAPVVDQAVHQLGERGNRRLAVVHQLLDRIQGVDGVGDAHAQRRNHVKARPGVGQVAAGFDTAVDQRGQQGAGADVAEIAVGTEDDVVGLDHQPFQLAQELRLQLLEAVYLMCGRGAERLLQAAQVDRPGRAVGGALVQRLLQRRHGRDVGKRELGGACQHRLIAAVGGVVARPAQRHVLARAAQRFAQLVILVEDGVGTACQQRLGRRVQHLLGHVLVDPQ